VNFWSFFVVESCTTPAQENPITVQATLGDVVVAWPPCAALSGISS